MDKNVIIFAVLVLALIFFLIGEYHRRQKMRVQDELIQALKESTKFLKQRNALINIFLLHVIAPKKVGRSSVSPLMGFGTGGPVIFAYNLNEKELAAVDQVNAIVEGYVKKEGGYIEF